MRASRLGQAIDEPLERLPPASPDSVTPTVFVVDDERSVRETLRDLLTGDGWKVEIYRSCTAFLKTYRPGALGCLVVDAEMPGMGGIELLRRLNANPRRLPAIITGKGNVPLAVEAMKAGAVDFVEKPVVYEKLLACIRQNLDQAKLHTSQKADAPLLSSLTKRQRQIMDRVIAGQPSKNIAADLGVSQRTVENHRAAIMEKTGARSLAELIKLALTANP